jgi:hypothetical protein
LSIRFREHLPAESFAAAIDAGAQQCQRTLNRVEGFLRSALLQRNHRKAPQREGLVTLVSLACLQIQSLTKAVNCLGIIAKGRERISETVQSAGLPEIVPQRFGHREFFLKEGQRQFRLPQLKPHSAAVVQNAGE